VAIMAAVPDRSVLARTRDGIGAVREPAPGETYALALKHLRSIRAMAESDAMAIALSPADIVSARAGGRPALLLAMEGGDGLEGKMERLAEFYQIGVRSIQLVHYRINELGDIQTVKPQHGGLTPFGLEVIKKMNSLGMIIDVAHATYDGVVQAAKASRAPLLLSHTGVVQRPAPLNRLISAEHAKVVASTGGMIGIWPPVFLYRSLAGWVDAVAAAVDAAGIDHVGVGSDMEGLGPTGSSVYEAYGQTPAVAAALLRRFSPEEASKILGGNLMRVFEAVTQAAG